MENLIAIITTRKTYGRFILDHYTSDLEFTCISSIEDARGKWFSGHIALYDADRLKDFEKIISLVKTRTRVKNF